MLKAALRLATATSLAVVSVAVAVPADAATASRTTTVRTARAVDTGPCGPVGPMHASDWFATTTDYSIFNAVSRAQAAETWQWRYDSNTLWRGDTRENVQQIFADGFTPRGDYLAPLAEYIVKGGGQNTAHLSTSCAQWVAQKFATYGAAKAGWVYEIEAPGGIDVNATAQVNDYQSPYLWNKEIDFPGGIKGRYIKDACKYRLVSTDPTTKVNTYENLGCQDNPGFEGASDTAR
ncbi:scabin-related ADP-ribosyltransferase [Kitasatospora sp. LaBMicrA B282]|uniref:scabin-related ADP-ribosyltransferase n=1 Tax=Kitasatospora sp. LaBMicrA B282 TaxID=3420949 RepID=UPI003D0AE07E